MASLEEPGFIQNSLAAKTFLNGAILGMTKIEIRRKFDEILVFSEIEKFRHTRQAIKRVYATGLAVAAHGTDILSLTKF